MRPLSAAVLLAAVLVAGAPGATLAHGGSDAFVHVLVSPVERGTSFTVIGADLGERAHVTLELVAGSRALHLGRVMADGDGHFETTLQMPDEAPKGYAELRAAADGGASASVWILVGAARNVDVAAPASDPWFAGATLPALLTGTALVLGLLVSVRARVRGRRPTQPS